MKLKKRLLLKKQCFLNFFKIGNNCTNFNRDSQIRSAKSGACNSRSRQIVIIKLKIQSYTTQDSLIPTADDHLEAPLPRSACEAFCFLAELLL